MKKHIVALLYLLPTIAMGCQVVLINNGPYKRVTVKDLNAQKDSLKTLKKGQSIEANVDPKTHALLLISMDGTEYTVTQHACSKKHTITLKTTDIGRENGGPLLTITKNVKPNNNQ